MPVFALRRPADRDRPQRHLRRAVRDGRRRSGARRRAGRRPRSCGTARRCGRRSAWSSRRRRRCSASTTTRRARRVARADHEHDERRRARRDDDAEDRVDGDELPRVADRLRRSASRRGRADGRCRCLRWRRSSGVSAVVGHASVSRRASVAVIIARRPASPLGPVRCRSVAASFDESMIFGQVSSAVQSISGFTKLLRVEEPHEVVAVDLLLLDHGVGDGLDLVAG